MHLEIRNIHHTLSSKQNTAWWGNGDAKNKLGILVGTTRYTAFYQELSKVYLYYGKVCVVLLYNEIVFVSDCYIILFSLMLI